MFNMLECFLSLLEIYGKCVVYNLSIFCPSKTENLQFHFIRVFALNYLIESLKTCSILTGLLFSIDRYFNVVKPERPILKKYLKAKINRITLFVLAFGFSTSFVKLFEDSSFTSISAAQLGINVLKMFYMYSETWISIVNTIHYVVNDFVLFFFNLVIDLMLVTAIRKNLAPKKRSILKSKETKKKNKTKLDEIQKSHDDTNKMVILSLVLFVMCRLPELAFEVHLLFFIMDPYPRRYSKYCITNNFCLFLKDITQFLYMFSYIMNVILYYKYNKNFRDAIQNQFSFFFKKKK